MSKEHSTLIDSLNLSAKVLKSIQNEAKLIYILLYIVKI